MKLAECHLLSHILQFIISSGQGASWQVSRRLSWSTRRASFEQLAVATVTVEAKSVL